MEASNMAHLRSECKGFIDYIGLLRGLAKRKDLSAATLRLTLALWSHANPAHNFHEEDGEEPFLVWPSLQTLSEETGIARKNLPRELAAIKAKGLINWTTPAVARLCGFTFADGDPYPTSNLYKLWYPAAPEADDRPDWLTDEADNEPDDMDIFIEMCEEEAERLRDPNYRPSGYFPDDTHDLAEQWNRECQLMLAAHARGEVIDDDWMARHLPGGSILDRVHELRGDHRPALAEPGEPPEEAVKAEEPSTDGAAVTESVTEEIKSVLTAEDTCPHHRGHPVLTAEDQTINGTDNETPDGVSAFAAPMPTRRWLFGYAIENFADERGVEGARNVMAAMIGRYGTEAVCDAIAEDHPEDAGNLCAALYRTYGTAV
jgi:hypothetical protein